MVTTDAGVRTELLEASDETIEDAVQYAHPMVLRAVLYQLTGDESVIHLDMPAFRDRYIEAMAPNEQDQAMLRRKAADWLKAYRDSGAGEVDLGPRERLPMSLKLASNVDFSDEEAELWIEELGLDPWARSLEWSEEPPRERLEQFSVTIIGAAMGGLNAAVQLKRAGIPYTIIEKNADVGGTWLENRYPGIRVDTPSRAYTHIYGVNFGYPYGFCPGAENKRYFDWVADEFDLRKDIHFNTEVCTLRWDDDSSMWEIAVRGPEGERTLRSNAVITAVGFLNRPSTPQIEGMDDFEGPSWHTARWPDGFDIKGKRFAVIGTGATGYQLIPELALEAAHVVVFQRTPQWVVPIPGYRSPLPPQIPWLERNFPGYANFLRFRAVLPSRTGAEDSEIDPEYEHPIARSARNRRRLEYSLSFLHSKISDPELLEKMTPSHPVGSARVIAVDPEYSVLDAIQRDNVTLVTEGIRRINKTGIEASDGTQYDVDVIVYATGFHATEYLFPMTVIGRGGKTINELWAEGGARAYRGSMLPGFPNLWMIYGPNTNGGLLPAGFHELVTRYALECMERLILDDKRSIEVKEEAYRRYNELLDERNSRKVWSDPRAHNYYWTKHGRSATMNPFRPIELYRFLRHPDFSELEVR